MKTKFSRRILAFVLAFALVVPMFVFNVGAADKTVSFQLGADGSATHKDGSSSKTTYSETVDGYTLNITDGSKMYPASIDAKGNGCIKFGTSSATGACTFTVPDDVTSVILYVGKYKANTTKIQVNGTAYTITGASNNGEYDKITVDTTTNKTVSFTTVSGGVRAMLNQIDFVIADTGAAPAPSISISGENATVVGGSTTLNATLNNAEGALTWTSSNNAVATVSNGVVNGVAMGTATITAAYGETTQTHNITVFPKLGELTIAEALEVCELTGETDAPYQYSVLGVIEEIDTAYNSEHGNISVVIGDGTNSILVYRMAGGEGLVVGDQIMVTGTLVNFKGNTPEFTAGATYEKVTDETIDAIREKLNAVAAQMSLAFQYEVNKQTVTLPSTVEVTDVLNRDLTGATNTTYIGWSGKSVSNGSGAIYAGNSAGGNSSIQLRHDTSKTAAGIVSTTSGGRIKSITVTWNNSTTSGRVLNIYASNTPYTSEADLWDNTGKQGTKVASFTFTKDQTVTSTYTFDEDYAYIGLRSNSGAMYLTSIEIVWESEVEGGGETVQQEVFSNSQFAIRCGVDAALTQIEGVEEYGIKVTAGDKSVNYTTDAKSWTVANGMAYITLDLGDIINDLDKLGTKFTVEAYAIIDGFEYTSSQSATYSVADMVNTYNAKGIAEVAHLYNYLVTKGLVEID